MGKSLVENILSITGVISTASISLVGLYLADRYYKQEDVSRRTEYCANAQTDMIALVSEINRDGANVGTNPADKSLNNALKLATLSIIKKASEECKATRPFSDEVAVNIVTALANDPDINVAINARDVLTEVKNNTKKEQNNTSKYDPVNTPTNLTFPVDDEPNLKDGKGPDLSKHAVVIRLAIDGKFTNKSYQSEYYGVASALYKSLPFGALNKPSLRYGVGDTIPVDIAYTGSPNLKMENTLNGKDIDNKRIITSQLKVSPYPMGLPEGIYIFCKSILTCDYGDRISQYYLNSPALPAGSAKKYYVTFIYLVNEIDTDGQIIIENINPSPLAAVPGKKATPTP